MGGGGAMEITGALPMMDARYVEAKTCVWWDIENCGVPRSCDPYSIAQNIKKSLADMNYKGVVTISAYGDTTQIGYSVQRALSSTGIALNHVPAGIKDASDMKILVDMLIWGYDNPAPANHLLISGDRDFSNALHQLSLRRYNILLAQPEKVSQALVSAAKTVWLWTSLVVGGRPVEKIPNLHDTLANSISNNETQGCSILYSSQPDDLNQKSSNNGNFDNHSKAKQISKSQSQPILISSSSTGNVEGSKRLIGSSDSSNLNQMDDSKTPDLGSNCIPKSQQLVDSGKSNAPCGPASNYTAQFKQKIPSYTSMSATNGSGAQESTISEMTNVDKNSTLSQPSALVVPESGNTYLSTDPTSSNLNKKNDLKHPSHTFVSTVTDLDSNCIPKSQQLVDSGKSNAPGGPTSNYTPQFKQTIPSYTTMSATNGSGAQESTISEMTKVDKNSTLSQPSALVVPESGNPYLSTDPTSSNLNQKNDLKHPSHTFVSTVTDLDSNCITSSMNPTPCIPKCQRLVGSGKFHAPSRPTSIWKPKIKQEGGNISNTSSSYSTKSSSPALPVSNPTNASKINATVNFAIRKNMEKNHKQQQNQCSQSSFQSRNLSGSNYNHSSSSSTVPTIRPNNYQAVHSTMPGVSLPTPIPDISRLNISDTANFLQGQMGVILEALNILKSEKISPTEANISDCIRYGNISVQNFNVKMALDYTVEHQAVVMLKLGNFMPLYVGRNDTLWNCVNIMDSNADHGTENFDAVLKFLSSAKGRSAILSSQCRYQAALILRELCLKNIVLGEILQLLHIIIQFRKWIIPHASGWQPLAITVFINSDEVSTSSPSAAFGWG